MRLMYCKFVVLAVLVISLSSCLGIKTGIEIQTDGSGIIDLVYTISETLDAIGKQDGNASQPPVPISKSDFEKTVSRIEGLSLASYKSENGGANVLVFVTLDFANINALAAFFDESGQRLHYTEANGKRELVFMFNEVPANVGSSEQELFAKALNGYTFEFSLKTQGKIEAAFIDENGNALQHVSSGTLDIKNNAVSYNVPMADLAFAKEPIILKIVFD